MDTPSPNAETPRRGVLFAITPFAVLAAVIMYLFFDQRGLTTTDAVFEAVLVLICVCLVLTLVSTRTFWWAPRIVAFIIFAAYLGYLVYELFLSGKPFAVPASRGSANPINAILGFCAIGIPCLLYALSGSTVGQIAGKADAEVTSKDLHYLQIAVAARRICLTISFLVVAAGVIKTFVS